MDIPNYDSWKLSSGQDDEKVFCHCDHCNGEIYVGEDYLIVNSDSIHEDCLEEYANDNLAERRTAGE